MPREVTLTETVTHGSFGMLPVAPLADGRRALQFATPQGQLHVWPLTEDEVRELVKQLTSVHVAGPGDLPGGNGATP
jgi:hypothetical protein